VRKRGRPGTRFAKLVVLMLFAAVVLPVRAQQDREREALRRAQQAVSRLQQENAGLQREKLELQQKLEQTEGALKKAQGEAGRLRRASKALQVAEKDNTELQGKLAQTEARLKDTAQTSREQIAGLRKQLQDAQAMLEATRRDGQQAAGKLSFDLGAQTTRAEVCEDKNRKLYSVTADLIERYQENRGAWEKFLISEPFTGLKSVEVENLLDEMRTKAEDNRIEPAIGAAARHQ
jgi:chromosome segregation ATPase